MKETKGVSKDAVKRLYNKNYTDGGDYDPLVGKD